MEEPLFPFYSEGDEHELQHCYDCGLPLPDAGDPAVIYAVIQNDDGSWGTQPCCRRHWRETQGPRTRRDL